MASAINNNGDKFTWGESDLRPFPMSLAEVRKLKTQRPKREEKQPRKKPMRKQARVR